jgi:hypothetical protein
MNVYMPNQNKQHILLSVGKMKLNWADAGKKKKLSELSNLFQLTGYLFQLKLIFQLFAIIQLQLELQLTGSNFQVITLFQLQLQLTGTTLPGVT